MEKESESRERHTDASSNFRKQEIKFAVHSFSLVLLLDLYPVSNNIYINIIYNYCFSF